jgi:lipoprotein-anchoring transpeptidase ErfK/SrfK
MQDETQQNEANLANTAEAFPVISPEPGSDDAFAGFDTISAPSAEPGAPKHAAPSNKGNGKGKKIALIVLGVLVGIVVLVYLAGFAAFSFMFMPNTTLDGQDISLTLATDVASALELKAANYEAKVSGDGIALTLKGADVDLSFDEDAYAKSIISQQHAWSWPLHITESRVIEADAGATASEDKVKAALQSAVDEVNKDATQPTNATIAFSETTNQYEVVAEKLGTAVDLDATVAKVTEELAGMPATIELDDSCLVQASVTSEEPSLATAAENANRYLTADIPLTLSGQSAGEVTRAQISTWVTLDDSLNATLDEAKLKEWLASEVAAKYDTRGSERTYTRPDGKVVTVPAGTDNWDSRYGWTVDQDALYESLKAAVEAGSTDSIEIPTTNSASQAPDSGRKDWGNRYIDIDLSEQYVRFYDDSGSIIWESACVTGDHAQGHDTPTGVYYLNGNRASGDVELRGKTDPTTGQPEYISHVSYWMPFIGNAVALHDASWRSNFGGSIYLSAGSHGCVNLPSSKAAELFNLCKVGDVVVVHC